MNALNKPKIIAVIPAYNEEKTVGQVVQNVKKYVDKVIVVDDGSTDNTYKMAEKEGAMVFRHFLNRGMGGALGTGIEAALLYHPDIIVTLDADGQHQVEDILRLVKPIQENEADVVIGSRTINSKGMPFSRKIFNWMGNLITYLFFGLWVTDSQSGLKAFSQKVARLLDLRSRKMEVSSEIIREIKVHQLRLKEIEIKPIYTDYSLAKGQSFKNGIKTLIRLILVKIAK